MKAVNHILGGDVDKFQKRYLDHQKHKKEQLLSSYGEIKQPIIDMRDQYLELLKNRRSQRLFNSEIVSQEQIDYLLSCLVESPSSCNRQAISVKIIEERSQKEMLGGLLVGGVGWCHRADKILLLFSNSEAYKEKLNYMPFLDAGVLILNAYLACESIGLGCCFINPNIREENINYFKDKFGDRVLCGAIAVGHYNKKAKYSTKITKSEILL